jgi:hypothetical protein
MNVITIGRSPANENDVVVNDLLVSRHHLQIIQDNNGKFSLVDFGSVNGTFVNGHKVSGEVALNPTDVVRIGNTTLPWNTYFAKDGRTIFSTMTDTMAGTAAGSGHDIPPDSSGGGLSPEKQRHGFVTFWLWLMIVSGILSVAGLVAAFTNVDNSMKYIGHQEGYEQIAGTLNSISFSFTTMVICGILSTIITIVLIIFIFKWRKFGFWGLLVNSVVFGGINLFMIISLGNSFSEIGGYYDSTQQIVIAVIGFLAGTFIFWAILQIKKNGVSCWDNLE